MEDVKAGHRFGKQSSVERIPASVVSSGVSQRERERGGG